MAKKLSGAAKKAYKKYTGMSAKKGVKAQMTGPAKSSRKTAKKGVKAVARVAMSQNQSSMKGKSSKKAVRRTVKKVQSRNSGMTKAAATKKARRMVRGRKWANS